MKTPLPPKDFFGARSQPDPEPAPPMELVPSDLILNDLNDLLQQIRVAQDNSDIKGVLDYLDSLD